MSLSSLPAIEPFGKIKLTLPELEKRLSQGLESKMPPFELQ